MEKMSSENTPQMQCLYGFTSIHCYNCTGMQDELYACFTMINWSYSQNRPYKGDTMECERRMYLHLYFNSEKAMEDEKKFNILLCKLQSELESGRRNPENEKLYTKYFDVNSTPVRGTKVIARQEAINEAKRNYGYFALVSNEIKDPIEALEIYRNKDLVEKAFGNLKERLNLRRMAVSSDASLDGKLFVEFVALIYLSYIKKNMQELLDELDIIECFEPPGHGLRVGEVTKRQIELYDAMGIAPPTSLQ